MTKIDNIIQALAETMDYCGYYTPEVDLFARSLLRAYGSEVKLPKLKNQLFSRMCLDSLTTEEWLGATIITPETDHDSVDTTD
jgi:hypothetical protein